jgi:hypothetical protein
MSLMSNENNNNNELPNKLKIKQLQTMISKLTTNL